MARWWRPTGANYFDRVPKSIALAAMAEVGGAALAERHSKAKKAELAQSCERLFAGELVVEAEVRAAALAWVPEAMRFAQADEPEEQADRSERPDEADGDAPDPAEEGGLTDVADVADVPDEGAEEGATSGAEEVEAAEDPCVEADESENLVEPLEEAA
jgi:ParB family chromosome partitioning protein